MTLFHFLLCYNTTTDTVIISYIYRSLHDALFAAKQAAEQRAAKQAASDL
jgi:hypothetical protein